MRHLQPDDGTRQLVQAGIWTLAAGALAALLTSTVFGGIGSQGPYTNTGWICLLVAMMCLPFGSMTFALGAAKWFRNRRLAANRPPQKPLPLKPMSRNVESLLFFSEQSLEHQIHGKERQ
jgi:hypothetical protein